jgi:hypothetical protein
VGGPDATGREEPMLLKTKKKIVRDATTTITTTIGRLEMNGGEL